MSVLRKIVSFSLVTFMTVSLISGCGKSSEVADHHVLDDVYREEDLKLKKELDASKYNKLCYGSGYVYFLGDGYNDQGQSVKQYIGGFKTDKTGEFSFEVDFSKDTKKDENVYMASSSIDTEGNIYLLYNVSKYTDEENYENYYLTKIDNTGKKIWSVPVSSDDSNGTYYGNCLYVDGKGVLVQGDSLFLYSEKNGKKIKTIKESVDRLYKFGGKIVSSKYTDKGYELREVNFDKGTLGDEIKIAGAVYNFNDIFDSPCRDMILTANEGIYGCNLGDPEVKMILSYIDSDIDQSSVVGACEISSTEMILLNTDMDTGMSKISLMVKVPKEDLVNQNVITLACSYLDYNLQKQIIRFNKKNKKFRIKVIDYSKYNTMDDYSAGDTRLNTDIISGNVPDILTMQADGNMDSYIAKGVIEPLDDLIKKDNNFDIKDYYKNIFDTFKTNGKLYSIVPSYRVLSVAAKTSEVGNAEGWSMDDLMKYCKSKNVKLSKAFGSTITREEMITTLIYMDSEAFIDWPNRKCYFDTGEFGKLLEFVNNYPESIPDSAYNSDYSADWRKGKALVNLLYLDSISSYLDMAHGTFGEDITLKGFPGGKGNGSVVYPSIQLSISSASKHKNGAWKFISSFFSKEYQDNLDYGLPTRRDSLEKMIKKASTRTYYTDENGKKVEETQMMSIGGQDVKIDPLTEKEANKIRKFISSLSAKINYNEDISNIIKEEAAAYFNGQKSVESVCTIIQSRVSIYVNENS
ncbi:ABC transporter substrate-binding protein [Butyrivibrio sp. NC3005]|uniref:ABC transporter substrate-binding protein n=1 Tax=Butyrivibrio sp. NC3005 TaxID=1280685 RepID=UPI00040D4FF0|nr:extracellular solute-binding protein [Butyrivibrio sp. NC3005]